MSSHMQNWPYSIRLAVIKGPCPHIFKSSTKLLDVKRTTLQEMWREGRMRGREVLLYSYGGGQWSVRSSIGWWSMQHFVHGCQKLKLAQLRYESDEALRTTVLKAVIHQLLLYHWAAWTLWLKPWKMCPYQYHWRVCVNIHFEQISAMERRGALLSALSQLRLAHPALPQLRDFQVNLSPFHTRLT